jgi:excinuclease ABC subunit C
VELGSWADKLPDLPGVYKFMRAGGEVLYVGKARSLRRRVLSYFQRIKDPRCDYKTRLLVQSAHHVEWIVTESEWDALLLENNLIKSYQPRYNVLLKDGKTYPYLCITEEPYPRLLFLRQKVVAGRYYGPFPGGWMVRTLLDLFRGLYGVRDCDLALTPEGVAAGRYRACVRAYMGTCTAPCIGRQSHAEYLDTIAEIQALLEGRWEEVLHRIEAEIQEAVAELAFERAHELKKRLEQLREYQQRSLVIDEAYGDAEVVSILSGERVAVVHHFAIEGGRIVASHVWQFGAKEWEERPEEVLEAITRQILAERGRLAPSIYVDGWPAELPLPESTEWSYLLPPSEEAWQKLIHMCRSTAWTLLQEKHRFLEKKLLKSRSVLEEMQKVLNLPHLPSRIECIDNSHIQGAHLVSSVVVFVEGEPRRSEYRRYVHEDLQVGDDFEAMRRVVRRRYEKRVREGLPLPDLLLIDGGKGQLQAAKEVLDALGLGHLPVFALAKKKEELFRPGLAEPLYIDRRSPVLRLLQALRDEAHRTAVGFHRQRRDAAVLKTQLMHVPGIGPVLAEKLLSRFGSVEALRQASLDELKAVLGSRRAETLYQYFHG